MKKTSRKKLTLLSSLLVLALFSHSSSSDPMTVISAIKTLDSMQQQKKMAMLNARRDAIFYSSLLEIQEGILDLQNGQVLLLQSIDALNNSFRKELQENLLQNSYDVLIGSTDNLVIELKAMKRDVEVNDSADLEEITERTKNKYAAFEAARATFFSKASTVELAIEMQIATIWETERIFMETIPIALSSRVEIALDYLARIQRFLYVTELSPRIPRGKSAENIVTKEREYFQRIQKLGWLDLDIAQYYPISESVSLAKEKSQGFVCGETISFSAVSYSHHGYLLDYMSEELQRKHDMWMGSFDIEGPNTVRRITKKKGVDIKGFTANVETPEFILSPYYDGYALIEILGDFRVKLTNCDTTLSNDKNIRACVKHKDKGTLEGFIDGRAKTVCDFPQNPNFVNLYDGNTLLENFLSNQRKNIKSNMKSATDTTMM
jgi:hypothetical protein